MIFHLLLSLVCLLPQQHEHAIDPASRSWTGDSLTVYVFLHDACVISQFYTPELTRLFEAYHKQKVGFRGYFPNASATADKIKAFGTDYHLAFPLHEDYSKTVTRKFGITVTPEVAVWDHRTDQLIYRGRIDDSYVRVGKRKIHPQHYDLQDTIEAWLGTQNHQNFTETQAIGCFISFTE